MDLELLEELKDRLGLSKMSKPALVGIVVVIVVVAVVAAGRLLGTATANELEISKAAAQEQDSENSGGTLQTTLFVHVSGAVAKPGLYELDDGARVADAVDAAGGFADDAATGSVNLARTLADGEQIVVSSQSEQVATTPTGEGAATQAGSGAGGLVNINVASAVDLVALPGIGEATAAKIIADRDANGPFKTIEDLKRVSGIGDKKFEALSGLICV